MIGNFTCSNGVTTISWSEPLVADCAYGQAIPAMREVDGEAECMCFYLRTYSQEVCCDDNEIRNALFEHV